jgi:outer membrane protein assembly factor BamB
MGQECGNRACVITLKCLLFTALLLGLLAPAGVALAEGPAVSLSATALTFQPEPPLYYTSPPVSVTVTNSGTATLNISGVTVAGPNAGDFAITGGGGAGTLDAGASRTITLTFTPANVGARTATLSIASDAPGSPHTVALDGTGIVPSFQLATSGNDPNVPGGGAGGVWPDTVVGTTSPVVKQFTITNVGNAAGSFVSVFVGGAYRIVADTGPGFLLPGQSRTFSVTFTPDAPGLNYTYLAIAILDDYWKFFINVNFSFYGVGVAPPAPAVSLNPASLSFPAQTVGTTSAAQSVTLTNSGNASLSITGVSLGGANPGSFAIASGGGSGTLAPGASRSISVTFGPLAAGVQSASLVITDGASGSPHQVSLSGTGTDPAPVASLSPGSLDFGNQVVGSTSGAHTVTLTNSGTAPLLISSISLSGANPGSFALTAGGGAGTLAPGAARSISLTFTPPTVGPHSATLLINSNAAGSPHAVSLTGVGGMPEIRVSPTSLDFGMQELGRRSSPRDLTVTNTGTAPLDITALALSGDPDFAINGSGGSATLAPGATRTISLVFTPSSIGERRGTLAISHNATGSPASVALIGVGTNPPPPAPGVPAASLSPTSLAFGEQLLGGASAARTITIASNGSAPLVIGSIALTGSHAADFQLSGGSVGTIAEGFSRTLSLVFTPTALGPRTATLVIQDNAPGSPRTVTFTGTGTTPLPPPLAADWPVFMQSPRQLGLAATALDPRTLFPWSVPLGSLPGTSPVVRDGLAFIGSAAGAVFAIDTATHLPRWQQPLPAPVRSAPAAGPDVVVVSARGLYGLRVSDGTIRWQRPDIVANDTVSPMRVGDSVYLGARAAGSGAVVYAVNAATGADVWPRPASLPAGFDNRATVAVFPELGLLFVGLGPASSGPSAVLALRLADGSAAWPTPTLLPDNTPPTALSLGWAAPGAVAPSLQPALFVGTGSHVTALNAIRGTLLWSRALPETSLLGPPVVSSAMPEGAALYVAGASGRVYGLTAGTGADAPGWLSAELASITGPMALALPFLYVPTARGLTALDAKSGGQLWSSSVVAATGVAVADGRPYVGTTDERLVGFSTGSSPPPVVVHDLAISGLVVGDRVSRQAGATVRVEVSNRGTEPESYRLLVRVQPGAVIGAIQGASLGAGEKRVESIPWPGALMGNDGPKSLVAQLFLEGAEDSQLANNLAVQVVTVEP